MALHSRYAEGVHDELNYLATWLPTVPLAQAGHDRPPREEPAGSAGTLRELVAARPQPF